MGKIRGDEQLCPLTLDILRNSIITLFVKHGDDNYH